MNIGPWLGFIVFWAIYLPMFVYTGRRRFQSMRPELNCTSAHRHNNACYNTRWHYGEHGSSTVDSPGEALSNAVVEAFGWPITWAAILIGRSITVKTPPTQAEFMVQARAARIAQEEMERKAIGHDELGARIDEATGDDIEMWHHGWENHHRRDITDYDRGYPPEH